MTRYGEVTLLGRRLKGTAQSANPCEWRAWQNTVHCRASATAQGFALSVKKETSAHEQTIQSPEHAFEIYLPRYAGALVKTIIVCMDLETAPDGCTSAVLRRDIRPGYGYMGVEVSQTLLLRRLDCRGTLSPCLMLQCHYESSWPSCPVASTRKRKQRNAYRELQNPLRS
ncbi:hypothetical protein LZ30DRAFT_136321 [Colletotrichum cereale]|nr:hypothetical protein LZ30DRAFT_136321 [Colletotrichum cereale]